MEEYPFANNNMDLFYAGGFGYAVYTSDGKDLPIGGLGGVINGIRLLDYSVNISLVIWTGFGAVSMNRQQ